MKLIRNGLFLFVLTISAAIGVSAQETQTRVIDEVVAVVNESVITLSRVKRESKNIVESYVQDGKPRPEAQKLVDERQGELITSLIDEELLIQKAKELGLESEVEAAVNQKFLELMKQYDLKTVEELYKEMRRSGVEPADLREDWKKQATRDLVLQREVQGKIYWGLSVKELKEYFEKNKSKFTKPERISFTELFLAFAGRNEGAVRENARKLHAELKAGADFEKMVKENGDPAVVIPGVGKAERVSIHDLNPVIAAPLKDVKPGDVSAPTEIDKLGIVIMKVDAREAASSESEYDENAVRLAILGERSADAQKKFMTKLRTDSFIQINDTYRPLVAPILYAEQRKEPPAND